MLGFLALVIAAGCQLLVPDDVPAFQCDGHDASCPSGLRCDTRTGACVLASTLIDGGPPDGDGSDKDAGEGGKPNGLGTACVRNADCRTGLICGTTNILTTAIIEEGPSLCTKPCCTSADCESPDFVCWGAATGGNYCVSAAVAERTPPKTAGKKPGETCTLATECRSGLCEQGRCLDTCCSEDQCAPGTVCRRTTVSGPTAGGGPVRHIVIACAAPNDGGKEVGGDCTSATECKRDICPLTLARCTPTCCKISDCASGDACLYISTNNDRFKACGSPRAGGADAGAACAGDADCYSRLCDVSRGRCVNLCCTSSDCASGEECRPSPESPPLLRCESVR